MGGSPAKFCVVNQRQSRAWAGTAIAVAAVFCSALPFGLCVLPWALLAVVPFLAFFAYYERFHFGNATPAIEFALEIHLLDTTWVGTIRRTVPLRKVERISFRPDPDEDYAERDSADALCEMTIALLGWHRPRIRMIVSAADEGRVVEWARAQGIRTKSNVDLT